VLQRKADAEDADADDYDADAADDVPSGATSTYDIRTIALIPRQTLTSARTRSSCTARP
jgi:hypothetical protein